MILVRSPLRITFGGAGSDLISYSSQYGGFCISASINKYSYIGANHLFEQGIILKYSENETIQNIELIKHPIFREALKVIGLKTPQIEIISMADAPNKGSGLGGSGSFSVALLKTLYLYKNIPMLNNEIAEIACDININKLHSIQGKQDEYISALGGILCLEFNTDGSVTHYPLNISHDTYINLEENLMLFYSGISHNTNEVLSLQETKTKTNDPDMMNNLKSLKDIGYHAKLLLESNLINDFADLLNVQYKNKRERMSNPNPFIDEVQRDMILNGAIGVKIVGSGNGGFFMAYAQDKNKLREYARKRKLEELRFQFDFSGAKQIV